MRDARRVLLVCAISLTAVASPATAQSRTTTRLDWLAGCWQRKTPSGVVEEQWTTPKGGVVMGMGRTVRRDSIATFEFMRIYDRGDSLFFAAMPNGAPAVEFAARDTSSRAMVFSNPANDFPHRVAYRYVSGDSLEAWIDGQVQGRTRRIAFAYRRVRCET